MEPKDTSGQFGIVAAAVTAFITLLHFLNKDRREIMAELREQVKMLRENVKDLEEDLVVERALKADAERDCNRLRLANYELMNENLRLRNKE